MTREALSASRSMKAAGAGSAGRAKESVSTHVAVGAIPAGGAVALAAEAIGTVGLVETEGT